MGKAILNLVFLFTLNYGFSQDTVLVKKLLDQAYEYESKNPEKALDIYRRAYDISSRIKYPIGTFKSTMYRGIVKSDLGQYDSALYYYQKALPLSEKTNSIRDKAITNVNIGNAYSFKGVLDSVPKYYLRAIETFELDNDSLSISNVYINLAALFETLGQNDKQISYLRNAIRIMPKGNYELLGISYGNLGTAYLRKKENKLAFKHFILSDSISKVGAYPRLRFFSARNLGDYHFHEKSFQKAISYYQKAMEEGNAINDEYYKKDLLLNFGLAYSELKNYSMATSLLKEAFDMGAKSEAPEIQKGASLNLSEVYESLGDFKSALHHFKTYSILKDSLIGLDKTNTINELETKYRTEKKDRELTEQKLEIQEQQIELQKKKTQYSIMTGIAIFLLVSSLLGWFLYQQRQKRKNQEIITLKREQQVKTLESLMEGEEKERFRIAKELHDGVNGDLSAIKYKLSSMLEHNAVVVDEIVAMIDKSSEQVRAISHNLIPPSLEKFDLIEALSDYCTTMNDVHKPTIDFQHIGTYPKLSKNNEINIYRIVQELVSNSIKHSEAREITVQLSSRERQIQITVEDNGKGYDPNHTESKGIGLKNIESRIGYLNASKDLVTNSKGTSYTIEIDLDTLNDN